MPEATATTTEAPAASDATAAAPAAKARRNPAKPSPEAFAALSEVPAPGPLPPGCGPHLQGLMALDAALSAAGAQFGTILKDADNPYFKSSYVSLPGLLAVVRPILREHHVLISSSYQLTPSGFVVSTTVTHTISGGWRVSTFPVPDPSKPQGVGAAGTYGLRLSLLQLLAISGEDDDGNAATTGAPVPNTVPVAQWGAPSTAAQPAASAPTAAPAAQAPAAWDAPAPAPGTAPQPWL